MSCIFPRTARQSSSTAAASYYVTSAKTQGCVQPTGEFRDMSQVTEFTWFTIYSIFILKIEEYIRLSLNMLNGASLWLLNRQQSTTKDVSYKIGAYIYIRSIRAIKCIFNRIPCPPQSPRHLSMGEHTTVKTSQCTRDVITCAVSISGRCPERNSGKLCQAFPGLVDEGSAAEC